MLFFDCILDKKTNMSNNTYQNGSAIENRDYIEAMEVVENIADLLKTGLDKETLSICVRLIEDGINPTALAHGLLEIRRNAARLASNTNGKTS